MKLIDVKPKKVLLNITPLVDVLFIMIIFFTITSTFLEQPGLKLELPKAQTAEAQRVEKSVLFVTRDSKIYYADQEVEISRLGETLQKMMQERSEHSLIISADEKAPHGLVVSIMDIARRSGVEKLVISTEPK